jgi:hypothetical protein
MSKITKAAELIDTRIRELEEMIHRRVCEKYHAQSDAQRERYRRGRFKRDSGLQQELLMYRSQITGLQFARACIMPVGPLLATELQQSDDSR